jgi:uncharacterized protein (DUF1015 family)
MSVLKPFKAWRPDNSIAQKLAAKPYDVLSSEEARAEAKGNEYSFYRINKPEVDLAEDINLYSDAVYQKGKENLHEFIAKGWLKEDDAEYLYIYAQKMGDHLQKGLVGCCSIDDYFNDIIKKHEYTRPVKENDRIAHMAALEAHIGPVFLTYKPMEKIDAIVEKWTNENEPVVSIKTDDGIEHIAWKIDNRQTIDVITKIFEEEVPFTYVADGHHRSAASAKVGQMWREKNPGYTGNEAFNFFLSVLFPANQLKIFDYNRVIKELLPDISTEEFLTALMANFTVIPEKNRVKPEKRGEFGLYIDGQWYRLVADAFILSETDPVESLDVSILSNYVIAPLLGIEDQRTDDRIDFVGGIRGLQELEKRVDSGEMKLAFAIPPVTIEQLMQVADSGRVMPPKSTWFEPKLRSGLFVHRF